MSKTKQILQLLADGISQRRIATTLATSRNTVAPVVAATKRSCKSYPELLGLDEETLYQTLFPEKAAEPVQVKPNYEQIHKELLKDGVTLSSLWEEHCDTCRVAKKPPYMYSQFCKLYSDYVNQNKLTMHIRYKPADKLMVDWAGMKFSYYDRDDAEKHLLFVCSYTPFQHVLLCCTCIYSETRYKNIRLILEAGQDLPDKESSDSLSESNQDSINRHTYFRGASYYGGGYNE